MPVMPGTPLLSSQPGRACSARQLDGAAASSRTAMPAHATLRASRSAALTPTLPICVAVNTTICPQYDGSLTISW